MTLESDVHGESGQTKGSFRDLVAIVDEWRGGEDSLYEHKRRPWSAGRSQVRFADSRNTS